MKRIVNIRFYHLSIFIVFCLVAGVFTTCHYLDIDMENKYSVDEVDYTKTDEMYTAVIGAYAQLRISGMHWANNMLWIGRDEDMTSGRLDDQGDALLFGYRGGYLCPNSFWALNNSWVTAYEIITKCNASLEALGNYESAIDPSDETNIRLCRSYQGEVRTIRAWSYYMMATTFGACIIFRDNQQGDVTRSTREHVCEYALKDLEDIIPYMERKRPDQMTYKGAYTAFTAEALAARFALLLEDYDKVKKLTDDIIQNGGFDLYPDYYNLFKIPGKLCVESMMEVQVTDFGNPTGDYIGVDQWFNCMGANLMKIEGTDTLRIGGWTFMRYNPRFLAWAKERGDSIRVVTSFLQGGDTTPEGWLVDDTLKSIFNGKAYIPYDQMTTGASEWGRNNNVRLIRYAEVLLMNAEARVRLGENGDASVNEVRNRAGLPGLSNATIEQIIDERRMELCGEWGLHYTDLVRTGMAATVLNDTALERDAAPGLWTEEKAYWPVPGERLTLIPELAEEPK